MQAISRIYNYYRKYGHPTLVMPASLRTPEEVGAAVCWGAAGVRGWGLRRWGLWRWGLWRHAPPDKRASHPPPQVLALAGVDLFTIPPKLLDELRGMRVAVPRRLSPAAAAAVDESELPREPEYTQSGYLFAHNEDPCAVVKLAEGIRQFSAAARELEDVLRPLLQAAGGAGM